MATKPKAREIVLDPEYGSELEDVYPATVSVKYKGELIPLRRLNVGTFCDFAVLLAPLGVEDVNQRPGLEIVAKHGPDALKALAYMIDKPVEFVRSIDDPVALGRLLDAIIEYNADFFVRGVVSLLGLLGKWGVQLPGLGVGPTPSPSSNGTGTPTQAFTPSNSSTPPSAPATVTSTAND